MEGVIEVLFDEGADFLGLQVEFVGVAGGEGVGAEHDAAFDFGAEAFAAGGGVEVDEVFGFGGAVAVVDAVVAGEVGGGFGGGDDVVGGDAILRMREGDIDEGCALGFVPVDGFEDGGFDFRFHAFDIKEFLGESDAEAFDGGVQIGEVVGDGLGPACRVFFVMTGDHLEEGGGVLDGEGHGADLVEGGGEGDEAVAGDEAVGGFESDDAAEGGGLSDGAAGVGAEAAEADACGTGCGRAAGGAAGDAVGVPGIFGGAEGGVFGGGAHGEFIEVCFAEDDGAGGFELLDDRGVIRGVEVFEHFGGASGGAVVGTHVVFDGDGDAGEEAEGLAGGAFGVDGVGLLEGAVVEDGVVGVEFGVEFGDGVEGELGGLAAGDFTGGDLVADFAGGEGGEHQAVSLLKFRVSGFKFQDLGSGNPCDAAEDGEGEGAVDGGFGDGEGVAGVAGDAGAVDDEFAEGGAGFGEAGVFLGDVSVENIFAGSGDFVLVGVGVGGTGVVGAGGRDGDDDEGFIGGVGAAIVDGELVDGG